MAIRHAVRVIITGLLLLAAIGPTLAQELPPPQPPDPVQFQEWLRVGETGSAVVYRVDFPSAVVTSAPENNNVPIFIHLPKAGEGPYPVVLILHYWGALNRAVEDEIAKNLTDHGVAAVLMTLPYHLQRTPEGKRSGELAIRADTAFLRTTTEQSLQDCRRALDFIRTRPELDGGKMGIAGTSLGAIVAALVYAVDYRLEYGAFVLGGVDLAHLLWNSSRVIPQREEFRRQGYTEQKLRDELKTVEPLSFFPRPNPGKTFVVGALYDTVVPPKSTDELIKSLGNPDILWLETGHYGGFFVQRRLLEETAEFFIKEFAGEDYAPPSRISVPTLRLTVQYDIREGMDIGVGLDVWSTGAKREIAATAVLTPRGPRLFVGRRVDRSLSMGFSLSDDGGSFGIMWSAVL